MKYDFMCRSMACLLGSICRKAVDDRRTVRNINRSYKDIILRAADIGSRNKLLSSYALAAYFIAMNRNTGLSAEENCRILHDGLKESRIFRMFMGSADGYFSEKNMQSRREWSRQTHEHRYSNDWVVDVLEKTDSYEFGLDYLECGVCKLCRDENCPGLAKYMCRLDFMISSVMGVHLERTSTLAEGGDKCDFRFSRQ